MCYCRMKKGLDGAAIAFTLSNATYALLLMGYTAVREAKVLHKAPHRSTWPGFTLGAFKVRRVQCSSLRAVARQGTVSAGTHHMPVYTPFTTSLHCYKLPLSTGCKA